MSSNLIIILLELTTIIVIGWVMFLSFFVIIVHYINNYRKELKNRKDKFIINVLEEQKIDKININNKNDLTSILENWCYLFENGSIEVQINLLKIARKLKLNNLVKQEINKNRQEQSNVLLVHFLGCYGLYDGSDIEIENIIRYVGNKNSNLSFESCLSLIKIDPEKYTKIVIKELLKTDNWGVFEYNQFKGYLDNKTSMRLLDKMLVAVKNTEYEDKTIKLLSSVTNFSKYSTYILTNYKQYNKKSICTALKNLNSKKDEKIINSLIESIEDFTWEVKAQLIKCITRNKIWNKEILNLIERGLTDKNWWIRTYSAESVVEYSKLDENFLYMIKNKTKDKFGLDALNFAIDEEIVKNGKSTWQLSNI